MSKNYEKANEYLEHENNLLEKRVADLEIELRELIAHCETIEERGVIVSSADETLKIKWRAAYNVQADGEPAPEVRA